MVWELTVWTEAVILAESSSDGPGAFALFLFLAGPITALGIWGWIKSHYRNAAARYKPEVVVDYKVTDIQESDTFLRETKSGSSRMAGANEKDVHVRAAYIRIFQHGELEQPAQQPGATDAAPDGAAPNTTEG